MGIASLVDTGFSIEKDAKTDQKQPPKKDDSILLCGVICCTYAVIKQRSPVLSDPLSRYSGMWWGCQCIRYSASIMQVNFYRL